MAKNNPFREKNAGLKSKKGIRNYGIYSTIVLIVVSIALAFLVNIDAGLIGAAVTFANLAYVAYVFLKNSNDNKYKLLEFIKNKFF